MSTCSAGTILPSLDELEKEFEEVTRNMSIGDVLAIQKGTPITEGVDGDKSPKIMAARNLWQKIREAKKHKP